MLKYIITFCIIAFCHFLASSTVSGYHGLIFIQQSPTTSYLKIRDEVETASLAALDKRIYLRMLAKQLKELDPTDWVIYALKAADRDGAFWINCKDDNGNNLTYRNAIPDETVQNKLKRHWPTTIPLLRNEQVWEASYDVYGSCIDFSPSNYFELSFNLLGNYNIGRKLSEGRILPGERYKVGHIMDRLMESLGVRPYLECYEAERDTFLHEVHVCFNQTHHVSHCNYDSPTNCGARHNTIMYPEWEE